MATEIQSRFAADDGIDAVYAAAAIQQNDPFASIVALQNELEASVAAWARVEEVEVLATRLVRALNSTGMDACNVNDSSSAERLLAQADLYTLPGAAHLYTSDLTRVRLRAVTMNNLGCVERRRGDYAAALNFLQQAAHLEGASGGKSVRTIANISAVMTSLGKFEHAAAHAREAIQMLQRQGDVSPSNAQLLAVSWNNLAMAQRYSIDPAERNAAPHSHERAIQVVHEYLGTQHPTGAAIKRLWEEGSSAPQHQQNKKQNVSARQASRLQSPGGARRKSETARGDKTAHTKSRNTAQPHAGTALAAPRAYTSPQLPAVPRPRGAAAAYTFGTPPQSNLLPRPPPRTQLPNQMQQLTADRDRAVDAARAAQQALAIMAQRNHGQPTYPTHAHPSNNQQNTHAVPAWMSPRPAAQTNAPFAAAATSTASARQSPQPPMAAPPQSLPPSLAGRVSTTPPQSASTAHQPQYTTQVANAVSLHQPQPPTEARTPTPPAQPHPTLMMARLRTPPQAQSSPPAMPQIHTARAPSLPSTPEGSQTARVWSAGPASGRNKSEASPFASVDTPVNEAIPTECPPSLRQRVGSAGGASTGSSGVPERPVGFPLGNLSLLIGSVQHLTPRVAVPSLNMVLRSAMQPQKKKVMLGKDCLLDGKTDSAGTLGALLPEADPSIVSSGMRLKQYQNQASIPSVSQVVEPVDSFDEPPASTQHEEAKMIPHADEQPEDNIEMNEEAQSMPPSPSPSAPAAEQLNDDEELNGDDMAEAQAMDLDSDPRTLAEAFHRFGGLPLTAPVPPKVAPTVQRRRQLSLGYEAVESDVRIVTFQDIKKELRTAQRIGLGRTGGMMGLQHKTVQGIDDEGHVEQDDPETPIDIPPSSVSLSVRERHRLQFRDRMKQRSHRMQMEKQQETWRRAELQQLVDAASRPYNEHLALQQLKIKNQKRYAAAIRIQKAWRGYLARATFHVRRRKLADMEQRFRSARSIQKVARRWLARSAEARALLRHLGAHPQAKVGRVYSAVCVLQRFWRCCFASLEVERRLLALRKGWTDKLMRERRRSAATRIQALVRGFVGRRYARKVRAEKRMNAALRIQRAWRGCRTGLLERRAVHMRGELAEKGATLIQAQWRGYKARLAFAVMKLKNRIALIRKREHRAANNIQRVFRGHVARKKVMAERERRLEAYKKARAEYERMQKIKDEQKLITLKAAEVREEAQATEVRREKLKAYEKLVEYERALYIEQVVEAEAKRIREAAKPQYFTEYSLAVIEERKRLAALQEADATQPGQLADASQGLGIQTPEQENQTNENEKINDFTQKPNPIENGEETKPQDSPVSVPPSTTQAEANAISNFAAITIQCAFRCHSARRDRYTRDFERSQRLSALRYRDRHPEELEE